MTQELPKQIRSLVDCLREQGDATFKLSDIASVTEVLITTMQSYFKSIDTSIYRECRALSDYIDNARTEIASLTPRDLENAKIPRAGMELDAIVRHTETATNTIMSSAETIMNALGEDFASKSDEVEAAVMEIFEACSFQDITGQRISKVVDTLNHIETRVKDLKDLLGVTEENIGAAEVNQSTDKEKSPLLNGPALEGEGIEQSEVDQLMGETDQSRSIADANAEKTESTPDSSPAEVEPPENASGGGEENSQDDIDALFG